MFVAVIMFPILFRHRAFGYYSLVPPVPSLAASNCMFSSERLFSGV